MRRSAAARIVSRVVLPSRVLAVELGAGVGVLVVVICTNRSVQRLPPLAQRVKYIGGPRNGPPNPPALGGLRGALRGASRLRPDAPSHPEVLGGPSPRERHGSARTLRAARG